MVSSDFERITLNESKQPNYQSTSLTTSTSDMNFGGAIRVNKCGVFLVAGIVLLLILFTYNNHKSPPSSLSSSSKLSQKTIEGDGSQISLRQILIASVDVARRGGEEVVKVRTSANLDEKIKGKTKEGASERVTEGDFKSHRVMYYGLRKAFPSVKVISEEHDDNTETKDIEIPATSDTEISNLFGNDESIDADDISVWIDPLDATQEYTENLVKYVTTMVCVAVKGVPIIGVIHKPFPVVETFWAALGHGHSTNFDPYLKAIKDKAAEGGSNKERTPEEDLSKLKKPLQIIVSRSHSGSVKNYTDQIIGPHVPYQIVTAAGAGYKVLEVIKGDADAYIHTTNIKKWDLCAGNAILNALDGTMVTLTGDKLDYSPDTNPVNTKGIIAFMPTERSGKFKDITLDIDS